MGTRDVIPGLRRLGLEFYFLSPVCHHDLHRDNFVITFMCLYFCDECIKFRMAHWLVPSSRKPRQPCYLIVQKIRILHIKSSLSIIMHYLSTLKQVALALLLLNNFAHPPYFNTNCKKKRKASGVIRKFRENRSAGPKVYYTADEIRIGACRVLVGKPEWKGTLERSRRKWEHNIRSGLPRNRMGACTGLNVARDRDRWRAFVNVIMNFRVPWNAGNLSSWGTLSFSGRALLHGVNWLKGLGNTHNRINS